MTSLDKTGPGALASRSLLTRAGEISYSLSRSSRRRTIEISVCPTRGIRVRAPQYARVGDITAFIHTKADWIVNRLTEARKQQALVPARRYEDGDQFWFLGARYPLAVGQTEQARGRVDFDGRRWEVLVPVRLAGEEARRDAVKARLIQWYRQQAQEVLGARVFALARSTGLQPNKIAVRTQKRIWGNCEYRSKTIHLNWYLVMAPAAVIDYVIIHELCHLEVPNHSARFWSRVAAACPDYRVHRGWLKAHGAQLLLP